MADSNKNGEDKHLVMALTRLLRPLVRFLLSRGFTYIRLIQIIRPLFVKLAEEDYSSDQKPLTDSRISVLTGLARRYVKELRQAPVPSDPKTLKSSPSVKLVAEWATNPDFLNKRGVPKKLGRISAQGEPSFEDLANIVSSDVRSRTLLDDLLQKGMIRQTKNGKLELQNHAYKPDKQISELIDYIGQHLHDHIAAATNNLEPAKEPFFERSAFQDRLTAESLEKLKRFSDEQAMQMLKAVYTKAADLAKKDAKRGDNSFRFRIGAYCYSEDESDNNERRNRK